MMARVSRIMEQLVHRVGRAGHDDAARVLGHAAIPRAEQRLPELAVPLHRVRRRQQERVDDGAARTSPRSARTGAGRTGAHHRCTTSRCACWHDAASRYRSRTPSATGPCRIRPIRRSRQRGCRCTATRSATGTSTSWARI